MLDKNKSFAFVSACLLIFALVHLINNHGIPVLSIQPNYSETEEETENKNIFTIKHVFHHGIGENHGIHERLDITPEFVKTQSVLKKANMMHVSELLPEDIRSLNPWTFQYRLNFEDKQDGEDFKITRMANRDPDFVESLLKENNESVEWIEEHETIPNITDRNTLVNLALMASNAYVEVPHTGDWTDVGKPWKNKSSHEYGWLGNGIRGHIFTNKDNSIAVISIKGTSASFVAAMNPLTQRWNTQELINEDDEYFNVEGSSDTVANDKINDNLLFSCCCARVTYLWTTVCDCFKSGNTCDELCLEKELRREDRYYKAILDLYRNVTALYPNSTIWVTGHSLGGALGALMARTYGLPAVTFQAPGELLATKRLHLPVPPGFSHVNEHIWHFGNTGDPIFMGVCNGASSTCSIGGYALETACHSGKACVYDTVADLGWSVSIYNHRIHAVIDEVILKYNETAECKIPDPCEDCGRWTFEVGGDGDRKYHTITLSSTTSNTNSKSSLVTTTTSSKDSSEDTSSIGSTSTTTEIRKCKKYNWWGKCIEYE